MTDTNSPARMTNETHAEGPSETAAETDLPDITMWSHAKMLAMQVKIANTIVERKTTGAAELRARAAELGLSLEELVDQPFKKRGRGGKRKSNSDE